ncbi:MAG: exodeoxyribonuclease VII small subunit [Desulfovibrionales bacterium]
MAKKEPNFETQLAKLQEIVQKLEEGELPLEKSVNLYKEGVALARSCRKKLEEARHEVEILSQGDWEPFQEGDSEGEDKK